MASGQWCAEHGACEAADGQWVYRICWGCGHAYGEQAELEQRFAAAFGRDAAAHTITFCPLCFELLPV